MDNSFVYLAACSSGKDSVLADAFLSKGAAAVVGNSDSILTLYNLIMEYTVISTMAAVNPETGNYYTLSEALAAAKDTYGSNDSAYGGVGAEPLIFGGAAAGSYRFGDYGYGTLSGLICKAVDRTTPISDASIAVYSGDTLYGTMSTGSGGDYSLYIPAGDYKIIISADGYIPFTTYATVTERTTTYMETFLMVEGSEGEEGTASGVISNALTGSGVEGVTLEIRDGWNNTSTGDILVTTLTDTSGAYSVTLPYGNYTMYASKDGFISAAVNIIIQEGTTSSQNGSITPVISGDSFRIVLTWGQNPRDLDSHVYGTLSSGSSFHVYFGDKSEYDGDIEVCNLDVDDTSSYGPETITLTTTTSDPYYYYIHKYAGSGTLASSEAQVNVYQGDSLVATFNVPTDQGSGNYWNVFAIVDGRLVIQNTITSSADTSYIVAS